MMTRSVSLAMMAASALVLTACATAPAPNSGFLSSYDRLAPSQAALASIREARDEAAAEGVDRVVLEPTRFVGGAEAVLSAEERAQVLREMDRQICYEMSERFTVLQQGTPSDARLRAAVTGVSRTNPAGGGLSAVANFFIPGPIGVRAPGGTGGLAAEAEMVLPTTGQQIAAIAWARDAKTVGIDTPSLSTVGDALQLAEPFADALGDAMAPEDRAVRDIADPDPCAQYGPRTQPAGFLTRAVTGLYVPEVNTGSKPAD